ncbi:hypothetical protein QMA12_22040 [Pseudoalteromonas sp. APC 3893]|nr:hypothetical protein [Pseudoalteromonas sp. APC 3893]
MTSLSCASSSPAYASYDVFVHQLALTFIKNASGFFPTISRDLALAIR